MDFKASQRSFMQLHLAVGLFGGAGLFGKWLPISAGSLVLGRAAFAAIFLSILYYWRSQRVAKLDRKAWGRFLYLGALLAFHWVAFFTSIQLTTVALGLLLFSTFPLFTLLFGWLLYQQKWQWRELALASGIIVGIFIIVPYEDWKQQTQAGFIWGMLAAASFALLTIQSKALLNHYPSILITGLENGIAALCLLPFFGLELLSVEGSTWSLLLLLGIVFTGLAHWLFLDSMRQLSATIASLAACMEPIYGILLAWCFLGEIPNWTTFLGGGIIIGITILSSRTVPSST